MKIFVDSDVIFDVLERREPFYSDSLKIFRLLYDKQCDGATSPLILSNIFYLFSKAYSKNAAKEKIGFLLGLFNITTLNSTITKKAFYSSFEDFEDAMQFYSCVYEKIPNIITRNLKDYPATEIPVYSPSQFLKKYYPEKK